MSRNIFIKVEYDGSFFSGWQRQPNAKTVQGILEQSLTNVCGHEIKINGTSRTDAGVHALGQCATFICESTIPIKKIMYATNNIFVGGNNNSKNVTPLRIVSIEEKPMGFHARYDAKWKTYRYDILLSQEVDIFRMNYVHQIRKPLNVEKMMEAANYFIGTHDFTAFETAGSTIKGSRVRTIYSIEFDMYEDGILEIRFSGDGFLYNMIRIMVGALVNIGLEINKPNSILEVLQSKDRSRVKKMAPPNGLYLENIHFENY